MASVDKRLNGKWRARWREYPGGPQKTRHFVRKIDAERFLDGVRGDLVRGAYVDPAGAKTVFDEWAQRVFASTVNLRPSTRARDDSCYRVHVEPVFGNMQLGAVDHLAVREWIAALSASGMAAGHGAEVPPGAREDHAGRGRRGADRFVTMRASAAPPH